MRTPNARRSALATSAMWTGLLGLGPIAILLGHAALWRIARRRNSPPPLSGRGRAWTGLILGYLATALIIWQWDHLVTSWYYLQDIIDTYRIMQ